MLWMKWLLTSPMTAVVPLVAIALFAHQDADTVNVSWGFLAVIGAFITAVAAAAGAFLSKLLPAIGQWTRDAATAEAERIRASAVAEAERKKAESAAEAAADDLKQRMYDKVHSEFKELLDRHEKDAARREGHIEAQDQRIKDLYAEVRLIHGQYTDAVVKNERLLGELAMIRATCATNRKAEEIAAIPTRVDGVVTIDMNGYIREWSPAATALFNWRAAEAIGRPVDIIVPEKYRDAHRKALSDVVTSGRNVRRGPFRFEGLRRDGSSFPIELTLSSWDDGGARFFSANITPLVAGQEGERPIGTLAASPQAVLNVVRDIIDRRSAPRTPAPGTSGADPSPTQEMSSGATVTVPVPPGAAVEVKGDSVTVGVNPPDNH